MRWVLMLNRLIGAHFPATRITLPSPDINLFCFDFFNSVSMSKVYSSWHTKSLSNHPNSPLNSNCRGKLDYMCLLEHSFSPVGNSVLRIITYPFSHRVTFWCNFKYTSRNYGKALESSNALLALLPACGYHYIVQNFCHRQYRLQASHR